MEVWTQAELGVASVSQSKLFFNSQNPGSESKENQADIICCLVEISFVMLASKQSCQYSAMK